MVATVVDAGAELPDYQISLSILRRCMRILARAWPHTVSFQSAAKLSLQSEIPDQKSCRRRERSRSRGRRDRRHDKRGATRREGSVYGSMVYFGRGCEDD